MKKLSSDFKFYFSNLELLQGCICELLQEFNQSKDYQRMRGIEKLHLKKLQSENLKNCILIDELKRDFF